MYKFFFFLIGALCMRKWHHNGNKFCQNHRNSFRLPALGVREPLGTHRKAHICPTKQSSFIANSAPVKSLSARGLGQDTQATWTARFAKTLTWVVCQPQTACSWDQGNPVSSLAPLTASHEAFGNQGTTHPTKVLWQRKTEFVLSIISNVKL